MTIRVLLVDSDDAARAQLAERLGRADGLELAGEAASAPDAVALIERVEVDVVLLDVHWTAAEPARVCAEVSSGTGLPVVLLVSFMTPEGWGDMKRAGAVEFVLKQIDSLRLARELTAIVSRQRAKGERS